MANKQQKKERKVPLGGLGSSGDVKDRFRDAYKPGAGPKPVGFGNPVEQIKGLLKRKPKKKP